MCHLSDPAYGTVDTLSKLSHDSDTPTARTAILAMGLVGAGTNNSRLAGLLRQLAVFHKRDKGSVLLIRLAQGLVAAGKGLVSISPLHSDRVLIRPAAVAAVLSLSLCALNLEGTLLGKYHHLLYTIAPALTPRMVMTLDAETREPVTLDVRIGTAVETVGQAGRPKAITGFQTHTTPALMNSHDRAEIADETWKPLCSVLEGVVLVKKQEVENDEDGNTAREARARAAAASALARTPSQMAGIMAAASGTSDV
jgi:26S proteasome regulatory subunit N1